MATVPSTTPNARPAHRINARRMVLVWVLLVVSMAVVALAGTAALPELIREMGHDPALDAGHKPSSLEATVWPSSMAQNRAWRYIVVHHSATTSGTMEAIERDHAVRLHAAGTAYHFIINNGRSSGTHDGEIQPTPRWLHQEKGSHTNVKDHPEFSHAGIGICLIGNFNQEAPTSTQMDSLAALVALLTERYEIPLDHVVAHNEIQNTDCPGRRFPTATLLGRIRQVSLDKQLKTPAPADLF
jgi:N-acetyl-anhydromuramyl-L-alanine amidase AmpD